MITVTPAAIEKMRAHLVETKSAVIRIGVRGGGCSGFEYVMNPMKSFDTGATPSDEWNVVVPADGVIIVIDQMSAMYLEGTTIDYVTELMGSGFKFSNPNTKSTCGCGSSFSA
jgi:iron-sulfur cluster assembly protein